MGRTAKASLHWMPVAPAAVAPLRHPDLHLPRHLLAATCRTGKARKTRRVAPTRGCSTARRMVAWDSDGIRRGDPSPISLTKKAARHSMRAAPAAVVPRASLFERRLG